VPKDESMKPGAISLIKGLSVGADAHIIETFASTALQIELG